MCLSALLHHSEQSFRVLTFAGLPLGCCSFTVCSCYDPSVWRGLQLCGWKNYVSWLPCFRPSVTACSNRTSAPATWLCGWTCLPCLTCLRPSVTACSNSTSALATWLCGWACLPCLTCLRPSVTACSNSTFAHATWLCGWRARTVLIPSARAPLF